MKIYGQAFCIGFAAWGFKVYHYDDTDHHEVRFYKSDPTYRDKTDAENACTDWAESEGIDVEMV